MIEPAWLTLARKEVGTKEVPGTGDNPVVLKYAEDAGVAGVVNKDAIAWCAAFVGAMLERSHIPGSKRANARSYEAWGVRLNGPVLGCIVVLNRPPSAWQGHVGLCVGADSGRIQLLAGNQGDAVSIGSFPKNRIVALRWPIGQTIEPEWVNPPMVSGAHQEPSGA